MRTVWQGLRLSRVRRLKGERSSTGYQSPGRVWRASLCVCVCVCVCVLGDDDPMLSIRTQQWEVDIFMCGNQGMKCQGPSRVRKARIYEAGQA